MIIPCLLQSVLCGYIVSADVAAPPSRWAPPDTHQQKQQGRKDQAKQDPGRKAPKKAVGSEPSVPVPSQAGKRIVPDAMGLIRAGLMDENGRPTSPAAAAKIKALMQPAVEIADVGPVGEENAVSSGRHLFVPTAFLRPRRLAPGEQGTLHVLVQLSGDSLVCMGSVAEVQFAADPSLLATGNPELQPARQGSVGSKFAGELVYEDTLEFRIPVTVSATARVGSYPVKGQVELAIHDGKTGQSVGLFATPIEGEVSIGRSLKWSGSSRAGQSSADREGYRDDSKERQANPDAAGARQAGQHVFADHLQAANRAVDASGGTAGAAVRNTPGFNYLYIGLGFGLLFAIFALLYRRR